METFHYVYLTTNLINGKQYVGDRTCNCDPEKDTYLGSGRPYFKRALKQYGKENFKKEILEFFPTRLEAFLSQEKYIKQYNTLVPNGYNISPKGGHRLKGSMSEETKQKIGTANKISLKGKKQSNETIEKRNKSNIGKKRSKKALENMSNAQKIAQNKSELIEKRKIQGKINPPFKGKHHTEESKKLISINNARVKYWENKKFSEEHKKHISESLKGIKTWNKGIPCSEETKSKISEKNKGKKRTEETKAKMSLAAKGKPKSLEHKEKCRIARLGKTRPKIFCVYCKKEFADYMYNLYHGKNCKLKNI